MTDPRPTNDRSGDTNGPLHHLEAGLAGLGWAGPAPRSATCNAYLERAGRERVQDCTEAPGSAVHFCVLS